MARERRFHSAEPEATAALAEHLGRRLPPGSVLALEGELGAGKTTFVRGLARGLGLTDPVSSPTFTLMHRYGEEGEGRRLDHFDAWMEGRERAFLADGGGEALGGADVAAVEWAERVGEWLPATHLVVRLAHLGPEERRIELQVRGSGPLAAALEAALAALPPLPGLGEERRVGPGDPPRRGGERG